MRNQQKDFRPKKRKIVKIGNSFYVGIPIGIFKNNKDKTFNIKVKVDSNKKMAEVLFDDGAFEINKKNTEKLF
ncbi:MAG: hypothetical protein ACTSW1_07245 [Candidatus Hodarchaeales archaeon]